MDDKPTKRPLSSAENSPHIPKKSTAPASPVENYDSLFDDDFEVTVTTLPAENNDSLMKATSPAPAPAPEPEPESPAENNDSLMKATSPAPAPEPESPAENNDSLFDDDFEAPPDYTMPTLDLTKWSRCVVKKTYRDAKKYLLTLYIHEEGDSKNDCEVQLHGPWYRTKITSRNVISVQAKWDELVRCYVVDKNHGFIVINPDTLISGTTVMGSLFCRRKGVLQERFRGIEGGSKIMVIGSFIHEVLQTVLAKSLTTREQIEKVVKAVIESQEITFTLYNCKMSRQEAKLEVEKFTDNIFNFVQHYIEGNKSKEIQNKGDVFQGKIDEIMDIEENLWVPQLGLKGKIDVSVRISRKSFQNVVPLELKTGRASFSAEHQGQLILYQLMLSAIGHRTDSGLLLYLREGIMKEVMGTRNERRDLIMLRNELSYYLNVSKNLGRKGLKAFLEDPNKRVEPLELPKPISNPNACKNCPYATICCSFAQAENQYNKLPDDHFLREVSEVSTSHLTDEDIKYVIEWTTLLSLEDLEVKKSNNFGDIWRHPPSMRQNFGRAVMNLHLKSAQSLPDGRYRHVFELEKENVLDITKLGFALAEYVIVSTGKRIAIASGFIYDIATHSITINLERKLTLKYRGELFIVDKHESQSEQNFNYANLGIFLDNTEASNNLRSIILRRRFPTFSTSAMSALDSGAVWEILKPLNMYQKKAVTQAIGSDSYLLIKGLPGTGKSHTLVALIRLLVLAKKSIIITSHTHSAVDNVLLRLKPYNLNMIRLGAEARIHPDLSEYSEHVLIPTSATEDQLEAMYASFDIVAVTCLGTGHPMFNRRRFDYCIVDEATQVLQPTIIRPLIYASKFVLVGDPLQLPPLVRSVEVRPLANVSLFERLDEADDIDETDTIDYSERTVTLVLQYRMNRTITRVMNKIAYSGNLICYDKEVSTAVLVPKNIIACEKWIEKCLQPDLDGAIMIVDTLECYDRNDTFMSLPNIKDEKLCDSCGEKSGQVFVYRNYCEAAVICKIITKLLDSGINPNRIGIIAPYRAQVSLLKKLNAKFDQENSKLGYSNIMINTIDQFQGIDKDVILYSGTRTGTKIVQKEPKKGMEILEDERRMNVALSRAKYKLIVVCDVYFLQGYYAFDNFFETIPDECKLKLSDESDDFSWNDVLKVIEEKLSI